MSFPNNYAFVGAGGPRPSPSPNSGEESAVGSSRPTKRARGSDVGASAAAPSPISSVDVVSEEGRVADLFAQNQLAQAQLFAAALSPLCPSGSSNEVRALEKFNSALNQAENPALRVKICSAVASFLESCNRPADPEQGVPAGQELAETYRKLAVALAPQPQPEPPSSLRLSSPLPSASVDLTRWYNEDLS